jgi:hypothetical protein
MMTEQIWLTWESQRRNRTVSEALGAKLYELNMKGNRAKRYFLLPILTLKIIFREKPKRIFVQNPSLMLAIIAILYGKISKIPIIVDAHNAGLFPMDGRNKYVNILSDFVLNNAALTIVTNTALKSYAENKGANAEILPDPIPTLLPDNILLDSNKFNKLFIVTFICTWARDEPFVEVIEAASKLENEAIIYITGNSHGKEKMYDGELPNNIVLTGFLKENNFVNLLFASDAIMDLTTREDCLVCGAYEAVAAQRPLITSDSLALRNYFSKGVIFVDNTVTGIIVGIKRTMESHNKLTLEMQELNNKLRNEWISKKENIIDQVKKL